MPGEPVVSFTRGNDLWVPHFQFRKCGWGIKREVNAVVRELTTVFVAWDLAAWFATPNLWIADIRPVELLATSPACVIGAARADRFIALESVSNADGDRVHSPRGQLHGIYADSTSALH